MAWLCSSLRLRLLAMTLMASATACAQAPPATAEATSAPSLYDATPPPRPAVPPQVRVSEQTVWYDVEGATDAQILASIDAASPIRETGIDGRALQAYTRWRIDWRYTYDRRRGRCRFSTVTVDVDLTTTLWRWTPPSSAKSDVVARWTQAAEILREHEDGHARYTIAGALDVFRALRPMQAPTCEALSARADKAGLDILERIRQANRRYDEVTEHGTVSLPE